LFGTFHRFPTIRKTCSKLARLVFSTFSRYYYRTLSFAAVCFLSLYFLFHHGSPSLNNRKRATMESMSGHNMDMTITTSASMNMAPTGTAMAPMPSSTGGMGGMDMGGSCKISVRYISLPT
jgi:hypothetical protein